MQSTITTALEISEVERLSSRYRARTHSVFLARLVFHLAILGFIVFFATSDKSPYNLPYLFLGSWIAVSIFFSVVSNKFSNHYKFGRWILFSSLIFDLTWLTYFTYLTDGIKSELMIAQPMYTLMFTLIFPSAIAAIPPLSLLPILTILTNLSIGELDFILCIYSACNGIVIYIITLSISREEAQTLEIVRLETKLKFAAVLEERTRIAREIHDGLGSSLAGLIIQSELLLHRAEPTIQAEVRDIRATAEEAMQETRNAISMMRGEFDLKSQLNQKLESFVATYKIPIHANITQEIPPLTYEQQLTLFRIAQECLTNIFKHANASKISIIIIYLERVLKLTIIDNGVGFNTTSKKANHYGLISMKERAAKIGANLLIESTTEVGTKIEVSLPVAT